MRFILLFCYLFLLTSPSVFAQNSNNYIQVAALTGLNFTCNSATTIENSQTISGAIRITLKSRNNSCSVYARVSSFNCPTGFSTTSYPLQLDYTSTTAPNASNIVTNPLTLTNVNQRMFTQASRNAVHYYYYNLIWAATNYTFPVGTYSFAITYTMTQP